MANIIDIYTKTPPTTGKINSKGTDKTPIEADGGLDLSKNESRLKKARGGDLNTKKYSDSVKR